MPTFAQNLTELGSPPCSPQIPVRIPGRTARPFSTAISISWPTPFWSLGSYFDGAKLSVKAPAGVTATVAGRYDECVLTLAHDDTDVIAEGDVTVSGPGVEVTVPLKQQAGISDITAAPEGSTVTGIYDLNGRRADGVVPGMYIVRYSDGTARKMAVK